MRVVFQGGENGELFTDTLASSRLFQIYFSLFVASETACTCHHLFLLTSRLCLGRENAQPLPLLFSWQKLVGAKQEMAGLLHAMQPICCQPCTSTR